MTDCKEMCPTNFGGKHSAVQCSRKATLDGYCGQHHPESVKKRQVKADKKWGERRTEEQAHKENNVRRWCKNQGYRLVLYPLGEKQ